MINREQITNLNRSVKTALKPAKALHRQLLVQLLHNRCLLFTSQFPKDDYFQLGHYGIEKSNLNPGITSCTLSSSCNARYSPHTTHSVSCLGNTNNCYT